VYSSRNMGEAIRELVYSSRNLVCIPRGIWLGPRELIFLIEDVDGATSSIVAV
jgi:hypothetical protein